MHTSTCTCRLAFFALVPPPLFCTSTSQCLQAIPLALVSHCLGLVLLALTVLLDDVFVLVLLALILLPDDVLVHLVMTTLALVATVLDRVLLIVKLVLPLALVESPLLIVDKGEEMGFLCV